MLILLKIKMWFKDIICLVEGDSEKRQSQHLNLVLSESLDLSKSPMFELA